MRIYLPVTPGRLLAAMTARALGPPPLAAFAVTPALREAYADADGEELEYAALTAAARHCLRLLAETSSSATAAPAPRRVVLSADVAAEVVSTAAGHPAAVTVASDVAWSALASAHLDGDDALDAVQAAVAAVAAADAGDESAVDLLDDAEGYELLWYGVQELPGPLG